MIKFKSEKEEKEFPKTKSILRLIVLEISQLVTSKGYDFVISDVLSEVSEDRILKRVSSSHREGRAVDVRTQGWPPELLEEIEKVFEPKYREVAALSKVTGKPNLILYHNVGFGNHIHIQVKK